MQESEKYLRILDKDSFMQIFEYELKSANTLTEITKLGNERALNYEYGKENFFNQGGLRLMVGRLWEILLKYRQNINYGYLEAPLTNFDMVGTFLDTLFTIKITECSSDSIRSWNKYRFTESANKIIFITNSGEIHTTNFHDDILSFTHTTLYFGFLVKDIVFIYIDNPWDITKYAFTIKVDNRTREIQLMETIKGLMLILIIPISPYISRSEIHKVNLNNGTLELIREISQNERYDDDENSFVEYGSFMIFENRRISFPSFHLVELTNYAGEVIYESENKPSQIGNLGSTGVVGYDMIRVEDSYFIINNNLEIIFKFIRAPDIFFDFFYIREEDDKIFIGETMTGELLKVYQLIKSSHCYAMTRKDNGTGYYIWISS